MLTPSYYKYLNIIRNTITFNAQASRLVSRPFLEEAIDVS